MSLNTTKSLDIFLFTSVNYPGQTAKAIPLDIEMDKKRNVLFGNLEIKEIKLRMNEVVRRRESSKESCNPNSEKYDELLYKNMADNLNCRPLHWKNVDRPCDRM